MRRARIDNNQREIVAVLRAAGCSVISLATLGRNAPDLLVGCRGRTALLEVKNPARRTKFGADERARLESQRRWHEAWAGAPPVFVRTPEEALQAVGLQPDKGKKI